MWGIYIYIYIYIFIYIYTFSIYVPFTVDGLDTLCTIQLADELHAYDRKY